MSATSSGVELIQDLPLVWIMMPPKMNEADLTWWKIYVKWLIAGFSKGKIGINNKKRSSIFSTHKEEKKKHILWNILYKVYKKIDQYDLRESHITVLY